MFVLRKQLEKEYNIPDKNIVCSKTKTRKMMVILNIIANFLQKLLVYQKLIIGTIQMK